MPEAIFSGRPFGAAPAASLRVRGVVGELPLCPVAVAKPSVVVNYGPICISDLRCRSQEAPDVLDDALAEVPAGALIPEAQVRLGLELRGGVGELERDGAATELDLDQSPAIEKNHRKRINPVTQILA